MDNRKYELFFVLPGTLNDQEAAIGANSVVDIVQKSADTTELHTLGKNRLAYPIKQIRYGYFYTVVFSAAPEKVKTLENAMRLSREVLRSMISYFNTSLTAEQKIAYTSENTALPPSPEPTAFAPERPRERAPLAPAQTATAALVEKLVGEDVQVEKKVKSPVERKLDASNLEEINKKLDDLISGDIMPTV